MSQSGNALLAIIGVVGLLAAIAVAFQSIVQSQSRTYDALAARLAGQSAVDAAVDLGIWRVVTEWRESEDDWQSAVWRCRENDIEVVLTIENESLRLNLNLASGQAIARELERVGVTPAAAAVAGGRISDFIDRDEAGFDGRPEIESYPPAAGTAPKNRRIDVIDELRLIPGVDADLFEKLSQSLSLYSPRSDRTGANASNGPAPAGAPRGVYRVTSYIPGPDEAAMAAARTAIVELDAARPFDPAIREWRRSAAPAVEGPSAPRARQDCRSALISN